MITFNTDGMVTQRFAFPAPIIDYILKNLQPHHLIKLYQSCKFFYAKYRLDIIRNLEVVGDGEKEIFDPTTTILCSWNPALFKIKNFWLTDSFILRPLYKRMLVPLFSHCTIKKLEACDILFWDEYEALTKAGTVKELKVGGIYDYLDHVVPLEDIIAAVPNATSIEISDNNITQTTFESLTALNHQVKVSKFILTNMDKDGTYSYSYCRQMENFIRKHAGIDCNIHFDFKSVTIYPHELMELPKSLGNKYNNMAALILQRMKEESELEGLLQFC